MILLSNTYKRYYYQVFVKRHLLATISIVLLLAVMVTLNLNSAVWAKDDSSTDSKNTFRHTEMINGKVNTQTNDNGNIQTNDNGNTQTNDNGNTQSSDNGNIQSSDNGPFQSNTQSGSDGNNQDNAHGSSDCDSECQKTLDIMKNMLDNPLKLIP